MTIRHSLYDAVAGGEKKSESDPRPDLAYSRTHLANQRTYAAWLRTGLSIAGAGLLLAGVTNRTGTFELGALFVSVGATAIYSVPGTSIESAERSNTPGRHRHALRSRSCTGVRQDWYRFWYSLCSLCDLRRALPELG